MTTSIADILSQRDFSESSEVAAIRRYVEDHFQVTPEVLSRDRDIIITVPSAALASTLRFHVTKLRTAASTKKRLVLRIR